MNNELWNMAEISCSHVETKQYILSWANVNGKCYEGCDMTDRQNMCHLLLPDMHLVDIFGQCSVDIYQEQIFLHLQSSKKLIIGNNLQFVNCFPISPVNTEGPVVDPSNFCTNCPKDGSFPWSWQMILFSSLSILAIMLYLLKYW